MQASTVGGKETFSAALPAAECSTGTCLPPTPHVSVSGRSFPADGVLNYNQDAHRQRTVDWCDATGGTAAAFDFTTKARGLEH